MDPRRLRAQEWLAGFCGAALLVSLFLDWYGAGSTKRDAWESFAALDVLLAVVGLGAIALAIVAAVHRAQAVPTALGSLLLIVGIVTSAWLAVRVASPPGGADRQTGLWIGLAACLGATLAAFASIRDQRFPRAVVEASRVDIPTHAAPPRGGAGT